MKYLHVRRPHLQSMPSPIDWLPVRQLPGWVDPTASDTSCRSEDESTLSDDSDSESPTS